MIKALTNWWNGGSDPDVTNGMAVCMYASFLFGVACVIGLIIFVAQHVRFV